MNKNSKNITVLYCLAVMFTIWCTWNSVNNGNLVAKVSGYANEVSLFQRQVASLIDQTNTPEQQEPSEIVKEVLKEEVTAE